MVFQYVSKGRFLVIFLPFQVHIRDLKDEDRKCLDDLNATADARLVVDMLSRTWKPAVWRLAVNGSKFTSIFYPPNPLPWNIFHLTCLFNFQRICSLYVCSKNTWKSFAVSLCGQAPASRIETCLFVFSSFSPCKLTSNLFSPFIVF